jgi:hypothetical protein
MTARAMMTARQRAVWDALSMLALVVLGVAI